MGILRRNYGLIRELLRYHYRMETEEGPQTTDHRQLISKKDDGPRTTDHGPRTTDNRFPRKTTDDRLQTTELDYWP